MGRTAVLVYGLVCYAVFFLTFLYLIAFVGDLALPKTIDATAGAWAWTLVADPVRALVIDLLLLGLFAVQHSVMARPGFKRWLTRQIPEAAERSTYVLASSIVLIALFVFWQPLPQSVWSITDPVGAAFLWALFATGWVTVLASTFLIDHFELFGLRQVWCHWRDRSFEPPPFQMTGLYRIVRHPLMFGFLVGFWAIPQMSVGHLLFAAANTAYILLGVTLEERGLMRVHGQAYADYRRQVPMVVPGLNRLRRLGRE